MGFVLSACAVKSSVFYATPPESQWTKDPAIIFIPGFYGTALINEQKEIRFANPSDALPKKFSLAMYQDLLGTPESENLSVLGVFGSVKIIPFLLEETAYKPLIEILASTTHTQVIPFAYDWRQDLFPTIVKLHQLILALKAHGVPNITLATHSMGGLLTSYYLRYGTQEPENAIETWEGAHLVKKVLYLGVPFRGVMSPMRNMQEGTAFYYNKNLLSAEAVGSFPSSYYLLPAENHLVDDEKNEISRVNNFSDWKKNSWSLMRVRQDKRKERESFTKKWLKKNKIFYDRLHAVSKNNPLLQGLVIIGRGFKTLDKIGRTKENKLFFHDDKLFSDGDETVSLRSANPPAWLKASKLYEEHIVNESHGKLWKNPAVKEKIMDFLTH